MKAYQTYIALSKYARWIPKEKRRETWEETVERYISFFNNKCSLTNTDSELLKKSILNFDVMPSMRCLMSAGKALERDNAAGYNCWASAIDHPRVFDELFYLLMCGGGVGFSVERQYINKLPEVAEEFYESDTILKIRDSKIGWASGFKELISMLYSGNIPEWDLSRVRPAGSPLKTFGGRASGPEPLDRLFRYTIGIFTGSKGRKLNSIECHDIMCKIASTVVVGSVRRSACISLSNLTDDRMRRAKTGQWWISNSQRALANNGTAYTEKPDLESFSKEWRTLYKSKSGERSIVNKVALKSKAEEMGREYEGDYLLNPCGEAILRDSGQACNLSEVIIDPKDTLKTLKDKVRQATILGTLQSTLTNFRYLRKIWRDNIEEERLLGVSFTGIMDHKVMSGSEYLDGWLVELRQVAINTNKEWASKLDVPEAKQITLIKPSGTVSQLTGTASGIHPRYSKYYIRRVRQDIKDPLSQLMIDQGIPYITEQDKYAFEFPLESPKESVLQENVTALNQLKLWKVYRDYWCHGNPSQTIYYTDDEFFEVADWVWKNWDSIGGLSFFPIDDHIYENAPYEKITKEKYIQLLKEFPENVQWSRLSEYEDIDCTIGSQEVACSGGQCEI